MIRRRTFIAGLGSAAAWPVMARAQQPQRTRRIGVLSSTPADDPESISRTAAFVRTLQELGWTRNVRIDIRWGTGDRDRARREAEELVAVAPDVILANGAAVVGPLLQVTRSIPVVFVQTTDPVGAGYVGSLARPGGNATGFALPEYSSSGKWLELLKQIAPRTRRAVVLRDPTTATGLGQFAAIQSASSLLAIELRPVDIRDGREIDRAAFAQAPNGGLVVTNGQYAFIHRELVIALAARHRLPAVYPYRSLVASGGLVSYGTDSIDPYREAARYVDRILKGEKPADLPVQAPTKFELVINLKTAKALGLTIPETLLATADEVIQ